MLVLSRKPGESVELAGEIYVTVLEVRGDIVKLGFDAPRDIPIKRTELIGEFKKKLLPLAKGNE